MECLQGSIFRLILLNTFINDLQKATTCPFMNLADDRSLGRGAGYHLMTVLPLRGTQTGWRNRLTGTSQNSVRTNASPVPGKGDALAAIQAGDRLAGEQPCGKGPGDPGGQRAECEALTPEIANSILGYISRSTAKRLREVIIAPFLLPRPHL